METFTCSACRRNAVCACICCFSLPLLCEEHSEIHRISADSQLPPEFSPSIQTEVVQNELRLTELYHQFEHIHANVGLLAQATLENLLVQFERNVHECRSRAKELLAGVDAPIDPNGAFPHAEASLVWEQLETWLSIGRGLALRNECRFQESCNVLEQQWNRMHSRASREVLVLGLTLGDVMGLRIGSFSGAVCILDQCIQLASHIPSASEVTFQLMNMKAAVLLNFLDNKECAAVCEKAIHTFGGTNHSEELFGTALFFLLYSLPERDKIPSEIKLLAKQFVESEKTSNHFCELIRLCVITALVRRKWFNRAEFYIRTAAMLAIEQFPTSILTPLCLMLKARILSANEMAVEIRYNREADKYFAVLFPGSLLRAVILEKHAQYYKTLGYYDSETRCRLEVRNMFHACLIRIYSLSSTDTLFQLSSHTHLKELALLISSHPDIVPLILISTLYLDNLAELRNFYQQRGCWDVMEDYIDALKSMRDISSARNDFSQTVSSLLEIHSRNCDDRLKQLSEKHLFLQTNFPNQPIYYKTAVKLVESYFYKEQLEKAFEIFFEAAQVAQRYQNDLGYSELFLGLQYPFLSFNYEKERMLSIHLDIQRVFVSKNNLYCFQHAEFLRYQYEDQRANLEELFPGLLSVLFMVPTFYNFMSYLDDLLRFYFSQLSSEEITSIKLKVYQVLKEHPSCYAFEEYMNSLPSLFQGQPERELELWLDVYRTVQTGVVLSKALSYLIKTYRKIGRSDLAEEIVTDATKRLQSLRGSKSYIPVLRVLTSEYCSLGNIEAAIQLNRDHICPLEISPYFFLQEVTGLANLYLKTNRKEEAVKLYKDMLQISENKHYFEILHVFFDDLCSILSELKREDTLIELRLRALSIFENHDRVDKYLSNSRNLSYLYETVNDLKKQEEIALKELKYVRSFPPLVGNKLWNCIEAIRTLEEAGKRYIKAGKSEKAELFFYLEIQRPLPVENLKEMKSYGIPLPFTKSILTLRQLYST